MPTGNSIYYSSGHEAEQGIYESEAPPISAGSKSVGNSFHMESGGYLPVPAHGDGASTVFVYVQGARTSEEEHFANNYPTRLVRGLGGAQIALGALATLAQVVIIALYVPQTYRVAKVTGPGIWVGVAYGLAGSVALYSAKKTTFCSVVAVMVLSIISAVLSVFLISIGAIDLHYFANRTPETTMSAFLGIMLLVGVAGIVVSALMSALCCRSSCCRTGNKGGQVYLKEGQVVKAERKMEKLDDSFDSK